MTGRRWWPGARRNVRIEGRPLLRMRRTWGNSVFQQAWSMFEGYFSPHDHRL
jgi:hypothetical protein